MATKIPGYRGLLLDINLSTKRVTHIPLSSEDTGNFIRLYRGKRFRNQNSLGQA